MAAYLSWAAAPLPSAISAHSSQHSPSRARPSPTRICILHSPRRRPFSLIRNRPFVDGNKRVGHAAVEVFLVLNGVELAATVDEAETMILGVAAGTIGRDELTAWIQGSLVAFPTP